MLPDLKTDKGLDNLRDLGYRIGNFSRPQSYKMQAEILDSALAVISQQDNQIRLDIVYLVLDSIMAAPRGFEFFPRFPKEEVRRFCCLAAENRFNQLPIPIVCPVCPDYRGHYQLLDGISNSAQSVLNNAAILQEFFNKRNFSFFIQMHMADVEAYEPLILKVSGETTESFLTKTANSIINTRKKIEELGLSGLIQIESMQTVFIAAGLDYFELKEQMRKKLKSARTGKLEE